MGLVSLAYFARTYHEAPLFSGPDGLLDHTLLRRLLPFTRLSLFPPGAPLPLLRALFIAGCGAALLLTLGIGSQLAALFLYGLAVSTYRWNFLVMYVDDGIMHLALFWMMALPIGYTLTLPGLLGMEAATNWAAWQTQMVSGVAVRCFLLNLALVYGVAGLWKWASPMWRAGSALEAVLKLPVSHAPTFWGRPHRQWLRLSTYFALVLEPALVLIVMLPTHHPLKWALLAGLVGFHGGIITTMQIPFANLIMLGASVVIFRDELMQALGAPELAPATLPLTVGDGVALSVVACLALLFVSNAIFFRNGYASPLWQKSMGYKPRLNPLYAPLWLIGLVQSYRLFDWIDELNYHVGYEVLEISPDCAPRPVDSTTLFPHTIRHVLLQTYLQGNLWMKVAPDALPTLRATILTRYARRYCRAHPTEQTTLEAYAIVQRITTDNLDLQCGARRLLLRFTNQHGTAVVTEMCLTPPVYH